MGPDGKSWNTELITTGKVRTPPCYALFGEKYSRGADRVLPLIRRGTLDELLVWGGSEPSQDIGIWSIAVGKSMFDFGLRYDSHLVALDDRIKSGEETYRRLFSRLSPHVGFLWKVNQSSSWFLSLGSGFEVPWPAQPQILEPQPPKKPDLAAVRWEGLRPAQLK